MGSAVSSISRSSIASAIGRAPSAPSAPGWCAAFIRRFSAIRVAARSSSGYRRPATSNTTSTRLSLVEVVFEVAGRRYPLEERAATRMAENLRMKAAHQPGAEGAEGARPIADAIELRLIEDTADPITLGGDGAEAVFYVLNAPTGGGDQPRALYHAVKRLHDERLGQKS